MATIEVSDNIKGLLDDVLTHVKEIEHSDDRNHNDALAFLFGVATVPAISKIKLKANFTNWRKFVGREVTAGDLNHFRLECGHSVSRTKFLKWKVGGKGACYVDGKVKIVALIDIAEMADLPFDETMNQQWREGRDG